MSALLPPLRGQEWLDSAVEDVIDPGVPIIDPHHHLWPAGGVLPYGLDQLVADLDSGHRIVDTVFVECGAGYRTSLIGKYLNGYAQLWGSGDAPYVPPGWTEWRGMKNVAFFNYVMVEPDAAGGYVENSYGSAAAALPGSALPTPAQIDLNAVRVTPISWISSTPATS